MIKEISPRKSRIKNQILIIRSGKSGEKLKVNKSDTYLLKTISAEENKIKKTPMAGSASKIHFTIWGVNFLPSELCLIYPRSRINEPKPRIIPGTNNPTL